MVTTRSRAAQIKTLSELDATVGHSFARVHSDSDSASEYSQSSSDSSSASDAVIDNKERASLAYGSITVDLKRRTKVVKKDIDTKKENNGKNRKLVAVHPPRASVFKGVNYVRRKNRWHAAIAIRKIRYFLGEFKAEDDAGYAYNTVVTKLADPDTKSRLDSLTAREDVRLFLRRLIDPEYPQSLARQKETREKKGCGVSWSSQSQQWRARFFLNADMIELGMFPEREDAVRIVAQAEKNRELIKEKWFSFPSREALCEFVRQVANPNYTKRKTSSKYLGVRKERSTGKFISSIRFKNDHYLHSERFCLGRFDSEEKAAFSYKRAAQLRERIRDGLKSIPEDRKTRVEFVQGIINSNRAN